MKNQIYVLPKLPYGYADLEPYISEEQLTLHHQKHHQAYVNSANKILEKLDRARIENIDFDMKSILKELSFNVGGHILHSLFWGNLAPKSSESREPKNLLKSLMIKEFGSFERFKKEFSQAAVSVEGSGWAALTFDKASEKLMIMQIEKHNVNMYPSFEILAVLDVWEHAYYLDYENERAKFIEAFWELIDWEKVDKRFKNV